MYMSWESGANSHLSRSLWHDASSSTIVLTEMVVEVDEGTCVCWGGCWGVGGVSKSDVISGGDDFMDSLGIWLLGVGPLHLSVAVDSLVQIGCEVMAVALVDLT